MLKHVIGLALMLCLSGAANATDVVKSANGSRIYHTGLLKDKKHKHGKLFFKLNRGMVSAPASIDLRGTGSVSKIKDQGSCGSCWAFAITKTLESARLKAGLPELDLAEQEMVSCDKDAYGCDGGFMTDADYVVKRGLPLESSYPYTASDSRCKSSLPPVADKAASWAYIGQEGRAPTVEELKEAIATYGTIFVTVSAGGADWAGARTHMTTCRNRSTNHMVTLVGYNEAGEFIIGNSWGEDWGDHGFAYAKRGCNQLASEEEGAGFIVYEGGPALPPKVRLPAEITITLDTMVPLGFQAEPGVTYEWYADGVKLTATEPLIWVSPTKNTVYKIVATSRAGVAESSTEIKVLQDPM